MISFLKFAFGMDFLQTLLVAALLFMLPLQKRPRWQLRFAGGCAVVVVASWFAKLFLSQFTFTWLALPSIFGFFVGQVMAVAVVVWRSANLPFYDALYGTICAYAVQHFASTVCLVLFPVSRTEVLQGENTLFGGGGASLPQLMVYAAVYAVCYFLVAKRLPHAGRYHANVGRTLPSVVAVLGFAMGLSLMAKFFIEETAFSRRLFAVCMLFDLLCCSFVLWIQVSQRRETQLLAQIDTERRLRQQQKEQYEISRESIALINQKCHDIRHQIAALRREQDSAKRNHSLASIEESIMIYDAVLQTGNPVLDTVLTEKSLLCEHEQIHWTCMAEGAALAFMEPVDLYTLFGNALDNAVESLRQIAQPERRVLAITLQKREDIAFLQIENYFDHPLQFEDGIPRTTKPDSTNHGYGMKSIHQIAACYGGTVDITAENNIFLLSVLLPIPAEKNLSA